MRARYHDGLTTDAWEVELVVCDGILSFDVAGNAQAWPLPSIVSEPLGQLTRLSRPDLDARLLVDTEVWRSGGGVAVDNRSRLGEWRLVAALGLAGAAVTAFVFLGMPIAAAPLARATPPDLERQIGANFEGQLTLAMEPCTGAAGQRALQALGDRLEGNGQPFDIRVRAVQAPFANAFALPGGSVLVTDDLIAMTETPDELSAVIAHEVAHVQQRHVMQAVWRSLGLGIVLDAVVGGGAGAGQQAVLLAGSFTDLRYSREAEMEADAEGMALLHHHGLSSQGMAPFFERLAAKGEDADVAAIRALISSHPDSLRRARDSRGRARPGKPAWSPSAWAAVKSACAKSDSRKLRDKVTDALSKRP